MIEINKTHYGLQTHQSKRENTPKQNPKLYLTGKLIKKKLENLLVIESEKDWSLTVVKRNHRVGLISELFSTANGNN